MIVKVIIPPMLTEFTEFHSRLTFIGDDDEERKA